MARGKTKLSKGGRHAVSSREVVRLPDNLISEAKRLCRNDAFVDELQNAAQEYRDWVAELKKPKSTRNPAYYLSRTDAKATLAAYVGALEKALELRRRLPGPLHGQLFIEAAATNWTLARGRHQLVADLLESEIALAKSGIASLVGYRADTRATARRHFMKYMMEPVFTFYSVDIPKNRDAPALLLCHQIATWCGDTLRSKAASRGHNELDPAVFVRALSEA